MKPGGEKASSLIIDILSILRLTGPCDGLAAFKHTFICRINPTRQFSSFELQLFVVKLASPVLFAVVYQPPV